MSKPKPALPERLYYRLADAANYLGCSTDDLLHYGACGYIELCASSLQAIWIKEMLYDDFDDGAGFRPKQIGKTELVSFIGLHRASLARIEISGSDQISYAWVAYKRTKGNLKRIKTDDNPLPPKYFDICLGDPSGVNGIYLDVSPANLWVRTEELRRFQTDLSSHVLDEPELPPDNKKPHGNAENNARNRESVLRAAMAVKANFPDLCGTYRDWAETIDAKAPFFWPETGVPPLKPETIERLLSDSHKLPNGK